MKDSRTVSDALRCPICKVGEGYHRVRSANYRCRKCGSVWRLGGEIIESPIESQRWGQRRAKKPSRKEVKIVKEGGTDDGRNK